MTTENKLQTKQEFVINQLPFIKDQLEAIEQWSLTKNPDFKPWASLCDVKEATEEILIALYPEKYRWDGVLGSRYLVTK